MTTTITMQPLVTDEAAIQAEVTSLQTDAARYRFLRNHATQSFVAIRAVNCDPEWVSGQELDLAVDAAMSESPNTAQSAR